MQKSYSAPFFMFLKILLTFVKIFNMTKNNTAILLLNDGTIYRGRAIGAIGTTTGELCFNTGMTGYQEVFTDPSYYGQLLVMTNSHIGNYGAISEDNESDSVKISGLICRDFADHYSRENADHSLQEYLSSRNVVGIADVDSRAIVRHIRSKGAMNAIISSETDDIDSLKKQLADVPSMSGLELASEVSTKERYFVGNENAHYRIAVMDYGVKQNSLQCFADRDCYLSVFPARTAYEEIKKWKPDGIYLSNGPGDPAAMDYALIELQKMLDDDIPIFGICLGHQLLALSQGIPTYKMHHGHRGINHPVKNMLRNTCEITSQNHGFGVSSDEMEKHKDTVEVTHINLNDNSIEGLRLKEKKVMSVQYHPEASPGPHDAMYLFDEFIDLLN